jgi:hypothetical protein
VLWCTAITNQSPPEPHKLGYQPRRILCTMGVGAILEPAVVLFLLFGGCWVNRNTYYSLNFSQWARHWKKAAQDEETALKGLKPTPSSTEEKWRTRDIGIGHFKTSVTCPNTKQFEDKWFSQVIHKFPFLVEVWYWALIYWVSVILYHQFLWRLIRSPAPGIPTR